jgi:hypothetical protein
MIEYTYIVDFAPILFIYLSIRNTGEAGEKLLRKRIKRVASRLFYNYTLTCGYLKAEEVFYGNKIRGLYVFSEN